MLHITRTSHGNSRCNYCKKVWKSSGSHIDKHMKQEHAIEVVKAEAEEQSRRLVAEVNKLKSELSTATTPKPPVEKERYSAVVYCPTCRQVDSVRIVKGCAPGQSGCFRCGNTGGGLVTNVNVHAGAYEVS